MCSRIKSSFPGRILEIPGIAVDNFESKNLKSRAFFLSHCHSDHTKGLFSQELRDVLRYNEELYIYMSDLSAAIVSDDCGDDPALMGSIKPLRVGTTHVTLPALFGFEESSLRVTLINAGHCLGSVMFLFHTSDKTVLYTGDFNLSSNDIVFIKPFHDQNDEPLQIDVIYVDTTFLREKYQFFPKRSDVINELCTVLKEWLDADDKNRVAFSLSAKYGYEYIFKKIYEKLEEKVYVNDERWKFYCNHPNLREGVTNQESTSKIHICRNYSEGCNHKRCYLTKVDGFAYLFIRFSAMAWDQYRPGDKAVRRISEKRIDVCFPTHCSRTELINFVNYFSPKKIVGFPLEWTGSQNKISETCDIGITPKKRKSLTPQKRFKVDRKVDKKVLRQIFDI